LQSAPQASAGNNRRKCLCKSFSKIVSRDVSLVVLLRHNRVGWLNKFLLPFNQCIPYPPHFLPGYQQPFYATSVAAKCTIISKKSLVHAKDTPHDIPHSSHHHPESPPPSNPPSHPLEFLVCQLQYIHETHVSAARFACSAKTRMNG